MVWISDGGQWPTRDQRFHARPDCSRFKGGSHEVSLDSPLAASMRPCLYCYPDAPRSHAHRRYCVICAPKHTRPCRHNGGMAVEEQYFSTRSQSYVVRTRWVWPDSPVLLARRREPVSE